MPFLQLRSLKPGMKRELSNAAGMDLDSDCIRFAYTRNGVFVLTFKNKIIAGIFLDLQFSNGRKNGYKQIQGHLPGLISECDDNFPNNPVSEEHQFQYMMPPFYSASQCYSTTRHTHTHTHWVDKSSSYRSRVPIRGSIAARKQASNS